MKDMIKTREEHPRWISRDREGNLRLEVYVQPGASKNEICGEHDGRLKIRVQAPPADGAANRACQKIIAKKLNIPKSCVRLRSGASSRQKVFVVEGAGQNVTFVP